MTDRTTAPLMPIAQHDAGALSTELSGVANRTREIKMKDICDRETTTLVGWEMEKWREVGERISLIVHSDRHHAARGKG